jgi:hypothetical protein
MRSVRLLVLVAVVGALAGCSTASLRHAEGMAVSGKAYAQAVRSVAELALSDVLDYEVEQIAAERDQFSGSDGPAKRKAFLGEENAVLKRRIELVETASLQVSLVAEYFTALGVLAERDPATPATAAMSSLMDSLQNLEQEIEKSPNTQLKKLTPAEKTAAAKLVGEIVRAAHAAQVAARLTDDAPTIGRHLRLLSKHLTVLSGWVAARQENRLASFYALEIEAPFVDPQRQQLPEDWRTKYKRYLRGTTLNERLKQAAELGTAMERAWQRYLAGDQSPEEVLQSVKDMQQLVQVMAALKAARAAAAAGGSQ